MRVEHLSDETAEVLDLSDVVMVNDVGFEFILCKMQGSRVQSPRRGPVRDRGPSFVLPVRGRFAAVRFGWRRKGVTGRPKRPRTGKMRGKQLSRTA